MRSEDAEEEEREKKKEKEEQTVDENERKVERSAGGERRREELEKIREESERDWEVVEVDGGQIEEREIFADEGEGKTKSSWLKGLLEKRSTNKNGQQLGKEEGRSNIGWEEFDLEEINSGVKIVYNENEDEELVVFDKYKETGLYVNNLNAHFEEEEEGVSIRKKSRQRVNSAENEDVKRIKSEETQKEEDGWDWGEIREGEDVKEVGSMKKKKRTINRKKSCRKGFHVTGCKCKPMALIADTSI